MATPESLILLPAHGEHHIFFHRAIREEDIYFDALIAMKVLLVTDDRDARGIPSR